MMHLEQHHDEFGARMGMWLLLFTELMLFGGLFLLYAVYFSRFPDAFHAGGKTLHVGLGAANTVVLLTSSLCVACSVTALRGGERVRCLQYLSATLVLAGAFLVIKGVEWHEKISHGIFPGAPDLMQNDGRAIFYSMYYAMTGLHAIHVCIGIFVLIWVAWLIHLRRVTPAYAVTLENAGLYWHLVDIVWIYLFPLFYLVA